MMKIIMKKMKNNLDEMQEQKLLRIEHNGFWFTFWALVVSILFQTVTGDANTLSNIGGESIILFSVCLYTGYACIKNGIWDRYLKANTKTNVIVSLVGALVYSLTQMISSYLKYGKLYCSLAVGAFGFVFIFIITIIILNLTMAMYNKKLKSLESENENDLK